MIVIVYVFLQILNSYLDGIDPPQNPVEKFSRDLDPISYRQVVNCTVCDRVFHGQHQLDHHLKSKKHAKEVKRLNKRKVVVKGWKQGMDEVK